jgi:hypothetical protein
MKVLCRTELPGGIVVLTAKFREGDYETVVDSPPYKDRHKYLDMVPSKTESSALHTHREVSDRWRYKVTDEVPGRIPADDEPTLVSESLAYIFGETVEAAKDLWEGGGGSFSGGGASGSFDSSPVTGSFDSDSSSSSMDTSSSSSDAPDSSGDSSSGSSDSSGSGAE